MPYSTTCLNIPFTIHKYISGWLSTGYTMSAAIFMNTNILHKGTGCDRTSIATAGRRYCSPGRGVAEIGYNSCNPFPSPDRTPLPSPSLVTDSVSGTTHIVIYIATGHASISFSHPHPPTIVTILTLTHISPNRSSFHDLRKQGPNTVHHIPLPLSTRMG